MKLPIDDITEEPRTLAFVEDPADLDARLHRGAPDWTAPTALDCDVRHYRAGDDLVLNGHVGGHLRATCARCAEEFDWPLDVPFELILTPRPLDAPRGSELAADDVALGFYEGPVVDLAPLVCEQTLLALPTRPLCREDCRGLCPRCGANMNTNPCTCDPATTAPRLGALRALRRDS